MSGLEQTGADELRLIVRNMDSCPEWFLDRYTTEQLVTLFRAQLACGWDWMPHQWAPRQVREALCGIVPQWDEDEQTVYGGSVQRVEVAAVRKRRVR